MVVNFASSLRLEINKALAVAHDIALGKDLKVFLKVCFSICIGIHQFLNLYLKGWKSFVNCVLIIGGCCFMGTLYCWRMVPHLNFDLHL